MPYPSSLFATQHGFSTYVAGGYLAQLYLRKKLNSVHNLLYDPERDQVGSRHYQAMDDEINEIQSVLEGARERWVPQEYHWNDDDPLPSDILAARLRAKYWGSQVILYRPFLRYILNGSAQAPPVYPNEHTPGGTLASTGMDEKNPKGYDERTIQKAGLAIRALIESTRAFHGIDSSQRIIITNVFGTAHA